jgi:hypothetical protein
MHALRIVKISKRDMVPNGIFQYDVSGRTIIFDFNYLLITKTVLISAKQTCAKSGMNPNIY